MMKKCWKQTTGLLAVCLAVLLPFLILPSGEIQAAQYRDRVGQYLTVLDASGESANIRRWPSTLSAPDAEVTTGRSYKILDIYENGEQIPGVGSTWYKVEYAGAYENRGFIIVDDSRQQVSTQPVNEADSEPAETSTSDQGTQTPDWSDLPTELKNRASQLWTALQTASQASTAADEQLQSYETTPVLSGDYWEKRNWLDQLQAGGNPIPTATVRYYNLYNIGSTPNQNQIDGARINGIYYAMKTNAKYLLPWTSLDLAARGGAMIIKDQYINKGQDTVFFQKFNVAGYRSSAAWAQYMQGIQAPTSEARRAYQAYANSQTLSGSISFKIPVFEGLPGADTAAAGTDYSKVDQSFRKVLEQFPASYHKSLIALHLKYPNWQFTAVATYNNWQDTVAFQMQPQRNLIEDTTANQNYVANHVKIDGNFVQVNQPAVEYYMDPRNFLTETDVFMFEDLGTFSSAQTLAGVQQIFSGNQDLLALAQIVYQAAKEVNTSSYMLASRMRIEISEWRDGTAGIVNSARGTLDVNYPPLTSGADSLSFMSRTQQISALQTYLSQYNSQVTAYQQYQADLKTSQNLAAVLAQAQTAWKAVETEIAAWRAAHQVSATPTPRPTATPTPSPRPTATPTPSPTATATPTPAATSGSGVQGDLNQNGRVDIGDYSKLRNYLKGKQQLTAEEIAAADFNQNGRADIGDYSRMRNILKGN
ncbi:hypothetical protein HCH52_01305 [Oscillospiraceae bacterium HV4-5-C5C]|nr:hypothetical protein [Oscillospiraceae bacterium HV4-5-C5C]